MELAEENNAKADIVNLYVSSISYSVFTLTDGAARTIVLLHANALGFNAIEIALMFALYELMGVITNVVGGFWGTQVGIRKSILAALILQVIGFIGLALIGTVFGDLENATGNTRLEAFWWIAINQALNGTAKDLMKISGKAVPKLVTTQGDDVRLFKLVSWLTGAKNAMKGVGFFLGGLLLWGVGYVGALAIMIALIGVLILPSWWYIEKTLGISKKKAKVKEVFQKGWNVNVLSLARFFLFGSRDIWFEVAAPIFLADQVDWADFSVGAFMAGYTIIYGQFQAATASAFKSKKANRSPNAIDVFRLALFLCIIPGSLGGILYATRQNTTVLQIVLILGLGIFAVFFAANSAVHSYMIVRYSNRDKVAMDLGFYYMANAGGRLFGTVISGFVFHYTKDEFGLSVCLWISSAFLIGAAWSSYYLKPIE